MTSVRFVHHIDDLADDLQTIVRRAPREMRSVVSKGARVGNVVARDLARESAGSHGVHYPKAFTSEMVPSAAGFAAEYGPDESRPQGGMSFEGGSRNQPAHNDLAKSADLIGGSLARETADIIDRLFWPR